MTPRATAAGLLLALAACAAPAAAVVTDAAAEGFTVRTELALAASPQRVYTGLTDEIASWWNPDHTFGGDAAALSLDARAGGLLLERLPDGGTVRHMEVLYADPGRLLRLGGGLGPLQGMAVHGVLTVQLTPAEGGCTLEMTYTVAGHAPQGLADLAPAVDAVLAGQMRRLQEHVGF